MLKKLIAAAVVTGIASVSFAAAPAASAPAAAAATEKPAVTAKVAHKHHKHVAKTTEHKAEAAKTEAATPAK